MSEYCQNQSSIFFFFPREERGLTAYCCSSNFKYHLFAMLWCQMNGTYCGNPGLRLTYMDRLRNLKFLGSSTRSKNWHNVQCLHYWNYFFHKDGEKWMIVVRQKNFQPKDYYVRFVNLKSTQQRSGSTFEDVLLKCVISISNFHRIASTPGL